MNTVSYACTSPFTSPTLAIFGHVGGVAQVDSVLALEVDLSHVRNDRTRVDKA